MKRNLFWISICLVGIVGLGGCAGNNAAQTEETGAESRNSMDMSTLLDESEDMKIHWESDSIDVDGNGITDCAVLGTIMVLCQDLAQNKMRSSAS